MYTSNMILLYTSLLSFGCLLNIKICDCASLPRTKELIDKLFQNYSKEIRPVYNQSSLLDINVSIHLFTINSFDDVKGYMKISVMLSLNWLDESLIWNSTEYDTTYLTLSQDSVWLPRFILSSATEDVVFVTNKYFKLQLYHTGHIYWNPVAVLEFSCPPDVTKYPFDEHNCVLQISPYGYYNNEVRISKPTILSGPGTYTENTEWELLAAKCSSTEELRIPFVHVDIKLKRRHMHAIVNIILPVIILAIVSPFVFILPNDSGERISYSITVLLAFSVYMTVVSDQMPDSSLPVSNLSYFLLWVMVMNAILVIVNVLQIRNYNNHKTVPKWLSCVVNRLRNGHQCKETKKHNQISNMNDVNEQTTTHFGQQAEKQICNLEKQISISKRDSDLKEGRDFEVVGNKELKWSDIASFLDTFYFIVCVLLDMIIIIMYVVLL